MIVRFPMDVLIINNIPIPINAELMGMLMVSCSQDIDIDWTATAPAEKKEEQTEIDKIVFGTITKKNNEEISGSYSADVTNNSTLNFVLSQLTSNISQKFLNAVFQAFYAISSIPLTNNAEESNNKIKDKIKTATVSYISRDIIIINQQLRNISKNKNKDSDQITISLSLTNAVKTEQKKPVVQAKAIKINFDPFAPPTPSF